MSIAEVKSTNTSWKVGDGADGPWAARLRAQLTAIPRGAVTDPFGWVEVVDA